MNIKPIKNEADYEAALQTIDRLMGTEPGTAKADKLEVMVSLVEAYESHRWQVDAPDPIALIEHLMEARGLSQKDLASLLGSQPRASEVLNRRRALTLPMIRALSDQWHIPAEALLGEYPLQRAGASDASNC